MHAAVELGARPLWETACLRAMDAVPAGGLLLELVGNAGNAVADALRRERNDRVLTAGPSRGAAVRSTPTCLPFADGVFLGGVVGPDVWNEVGGQEWIGSVLSEMARVATRYVVLGSRHPVTLLAGAEPAGEPRFPHRYWNAALEKHGFRPLSRGARAPFLHPEWAYVFVRA